MTLRPPTAAALVAAVTLVLPGGPFFAHAASPDLHAGLDPALQRGLEGAIGKVGLAPAVADRRLAVALVDLSAAGTPHLAMLNGDHMMYAASLPKIAILLGAFVQAERGKLVLDEPTLAALHRMIRSSSNADASAVLAKVGEEALLEILTSPRYRLYDPATGGGLWVKGLESRPDARLYRKSGTWRQFHSDSALVEGRRRRFILVGIAEDPQGGEWLERIAAPLHDLVDPPSAGAPAP